MLTSFSHVVFAFVLYSMLGWFMETILMSVTARRYLNRGLLQGPWIPSYGLGTIFIVLTSNIFHEQPLLVFIISAGIGTFVYYFMNWLLMQIFDTKLIIFTSKFSNLKYSILLHAVLQVLFWLIIVYAVHPVLTKVITEVVFRYSRLISSLLFALLGMDFLNSISGITNMRQRLEELRKLLFELDNTHFTWYNDDDKIESIKDSALTLSLPLVRKYV